MLRRISGFLSPQWTTLTQFTGDSYLQSMIGHGLKAASQSELVDKLIARGFLVAENPSFVHKVKEVDRAKFLKNRDNPYSNTPVSLGNGHAMSTPHFHAQIISLLSAKLGPGRIAVELGCGSGYIPAVMASVGCEKVFAVEQDAQILEQARHNLQPYQNIVVTDSVPEDVKIDAIYISPFLPSTDTLMEMLNGLSLAYDAVVVASVKDHPEAIDQILVLLENEPNGWKRTDLFRVMCEPLVYCH